MGLQCKARGEMGKTKLQVRRSKRRKRRVRTEAEMIAREAKKLRRLMRPTESRRWRIAERLKLNA